MNKFEKAKHLGEGAFGHAYLVRAKESNKMMVMKQVNMTKVC